jgi:hypothetical protein
LIGNPRWRYGDGPGTLAQIRHDRPDIAILGIKFPHQELRQSLPGYEVIRRFDGNICWKCGIYEADSFVLLRRTDPPAE